MRLLVDIRHLADQKPTGVGHYTIELLQALKKRRDVELVLFFSGTKKAKLRLPKALKSFTVAERSIPSKLVKLLFLLRLTTIESLAHNSCDHLLLPNNCVVHTRLPFTLTVHDITPKLFPEFFTLKDRTAFNLTFRGLLKHAKTILAVSHSTKRDLESIYAIPPASVHVTPLGVHSMFAPKKPPSDISYLSNYTFTKPYFAFLGTLEPRKNVESLIEAFERFRESQTVPYSLVLAGKFGWKAKNLKRKLKNSKHKDYITHLSYIPHKHRPALLRHAAAFVYPSFYEGFGLPVLEAMACGTPVITSVTSSLPEVSGRAALHIDPFDPADIERAMHLVCDPDVQASLSENGIQSSKLYSWDKTAERTMKAIL